MPPRAHLAKFGDILLVIAEEVLLASVGQRPGMLLKHPTIYRASPQQRTILPKMSVTSRLTHSVLGDRDISVNKIDKMSAFVELTFNEEPPTL